MTQDRKRLYPGFLFVFEGIDGTGKSTICAAIQDRLVKEGHSVVLLREPTSESEWGIEIRTRSPTGDLSPSEELELFIRDRDWHIKNRITPSLENGEIILLDRYFFATGAYQYTSTGIPWKDILKRNREEINAPEPDIVILLDVSAEIGLSRVIGSRGEKNEQFEQLDRLVKVRKAYLEMAQEDVANFIIFDSTKSLELLIDKIYQVITTFIQKLN
ncbi:MAG: dTMP kinase [Candidatus Thorarchaeota archaeon]